MPIDPLNVGNILKVEHVEVKLKRPNVDFVRGLAKVNTVFDFLPANAMDSSELVEPFRENVPTNREDIVDWMHDASADQAIIEAYENEYNKHSEVRGASGDGYIPGVYVAGLRCRGHYNKSYYATRRGYAEVETPAGSFKIPYRGKATFAKNNVLAWGAFPFAYGVQILVTLLRWLKPAETPIKDRVRFASSHGRTAPNFVVVATRVPTPLCTMRIGITSDKSQKIQIKGRGLEGSYHNVLFEDSFEVDEGEQEVIYNVFGFPVVPKFTLELQPQDHCKTVLDYLDTIP
ncbi:MAG: hypothetical protein J7J30_02240 [Candidatus Odinarchaeota archaeon]|nr:hypothetical protein [Candidatus Odinarchaeota archaeon]